MENMCAVLVHIDIHHRLRVNVSGNVLSLIDHQSTSATLLHLMGKNRSEQPRAYYQIIVLHHTSSTALYLSSCA